MESYADSDSSVMPEPRRPFNIRQEDNSYNGANTISIGVSNSDGKGIENATESLNQTLQRFQSMIKQVEQRFADRERVSSNSQLEPHHHQHSNQRSSYAMMSPERPTRVNEYDVAKKEVEEKQS